MEDLKIQAWLQSIWECSNLPCVTRCTMTAMAMVVLVLVGASSMAQVLAQCGTTSELVACLPAAEANVQPSAECCTVLSGYLSTATPEACLCQAATSSAFESSGADVQFAVQIPQKCNLSYRAGTQCDGVTIPGGQ